MLNKKTKNNIKSEKGITLIALVITVIVLLILAGISISMLSGDNSILNKAGQARDMTGEKQIQEKIRLAVAGAIANGNGSITEEHLTDELDKQFWENGYDLEEKGDYWEVKVGNVTENVSKSGTTSSGGSQDNNDDDGDTSNLTPEELAAIAKNNTEHPTDQIGEITSSVTDTNLKDSTKIKAVLTGDVPIPVEANYLLGTVDTGVVIEYKGSQFVWVPVPNAVYDNSKDDQLPKSSATGTLTNTNHEYTPMAINTGTKAEPVYKGLLYSYNSTNGAYLKYNSASPYQGTTSQYREPAYLSDADDYDDNMTYEGFFTESELQTSYNTMVQSVAKYGGFFVGRYETSYNTIKNKVESVADVKPASASGINTNRWYGLYQKQKEFTGSTDKMTSNMIWGSQYDAMLNWALTGADKGHVSAKTYGNHQGTSVGAFNCGNYNNGSGGFQVKCVKSKIYIIKV